MKPLLKGPSLGSEMSESLESRVCLSSPETTLDAAPLTNSGDSSIEIPLQNSIAKTAVKAATNAGLVKATVPIWNFDRFKATGLYEEAWTNVKGKDYSPREISWMGNKIGFIFSVNSKNLAKWSSTVTFKFYVENNYSTGAKVQIWAGPKGSDKPVGKIIKITHNGEYSLQIKKSVFRAGTNKITIFGTNVGVGYGHYSPTFILSSTSLERTAWVVPPPSITETIVNHDFGNEVCQGDTLSINGSFNGKGNGVIKYIWNIWGPGDSQSYNSEILTTTMKNGHAPIPTYLGLPTKKLGSYSVWAEVLKPDLFTNDHCDAWYNVVAPEPYIYLKDLPQSTNTTGPVGGKVGGISGDNANYKIAMYMKKSDGWWIKPSETNPEMFLDSIGNWSTNISIDADSTAIKIYLLSKNTPTPIVKGGDLPIFSSIAIWDSGEDYW